jgi:hypothetical protein
MPLRRAAAPGHPPNGEATTPSLPQGAKVFPEGFYLAVKQGQAVAAVYPVGGKTDIVVFSNLSATAWQGMVVALPQAKEHPIVVSQFENGKWRHLGQWSDMNFPLEPKGYSVFKFQRAAASNPLPRE